MLVGDLLTKLRRRLRDTGTTASEQLWTDDELIDDYANEARNTMFRRVKNLIIDSTTTTSSTGVYLCSVPITAGTTKYELNKYILEIQRAQFTDETYPLEERNTEWLDENIPNWKYDTTRGTPVYYCLDLDSGYFTLVPIPIADKTLNITAKRRPIAPLTAASLCDDLGFLETYHEDIIPGIIALAFMKKDSQTDRPEQVAYYSKIFEDKLKALELENFRRMHTVGNMRVRLANMAK